MHVLADLADEKHLTDPYPYLAWLREEHPVHRDPGGCYLVSRHADCLRVFDKVDFRRPDPDQMATLFPAARRYKTQRLLSNVVSMKNPPEHTRLRRLFSRDFGPRRMSELADNTRGICESLLDAIAGPLDDGEAVDLHRTLSLRLPMQVMGELIGIPPADRPHLFALVPTVLAGLAPSAPEATMVAADQASNEVEQYFLALCDERRREPRSDLLTAWVLVEDQQDGRLSHDELMSMVWGIVAGGLGTTSSAISSALLAMLRHPASAWLSGDERQVRAFNQEVVRHESPSLVGGVPYFAVRDVELGGVPIAAGSEVRAVLGAANRDPAAFPEPDRFDPSRDTTHSLAFGDGLHYCLGSHVAMMQLATLLPLVHRRFPSLALAGDPRWGKRIPLRCLESLPVRLGKPGSPS